MPTSIACDELACCRNCCCIWARLVLSGWNLIVRGTIFFHLLCQTTNYPVGCSIRSGVEFSFNDYNLRSFCKHPRSMQYFFSDSRILFCCFKGSRAFLSSLCLYFFVVPGGAKQLWLFERTFLNWISDLLIKEPTSEWYTKLGETVGWIDNICRHNYVPSLSTKLNKLFGSTSFSFRPGPRIHPGTGTQPQCSLEIE